MTHAKKPSKGAHWLAVDRGLVSNASMFANRGDPWFSRRESQGEFPTVGDEIPDYDAYLKADKAREKAQGPKIKSLTIRSSRNPQRMKALGAIMRARKAIPK